MPNRFYNIERPRKDKKLPIVLSKDNVKKIIEHTNNIKHRCIVSLLYSAGLRRSELLNLKLSDIDSSRMLVFIKDSKGNKDRYTLLSTNILNDLRLYYKEWKPTTYLFEGQKNEQYSAASVGKIVTEAAIKAGIKKRVSPHTLRHSFASHILRGGADIRTIQELLGHSSLSSTQIYTKLDEKSLLDIYDKSHPHSKDKI